MWFAQNTQHDTSKVLRLPRKMTMDTSKVLRLPRKLQHIFWKRRKSIVPATQNDFRHVAEHVLMSRSATRNETTTHWKPPKMTTSAELPIGTAILREFVRTVADGCERLRTVATTNATSSEHTLNPQTPRVKREPLLRIREKWIDEVPAVRDVVFPSEPHGPPRLTTACQAEQQLWRAGYGVPVELFAPFTDSCVEVMKPLIEAFSKDVSRHGNC